MLAVQAVRADGSQTQLGEGRTHPWVGLFREGRPQAWPEMSGGLSGSSQLSKLSSRGRPYAPKTDSRRLLISVAAP